jgi:hypothetical protein
VAVAVAACGTAILTPRRGIGNDPAVGFQLDSSWKVDGLPCASCLADNCQVFVS